MFFLYTFIYIYIYFINDIFHSKTRMLSSAYTLGLFLFKRKKDGNNTDFVLATFYLFYENFFFLQ